MYTLKNGVVFDIKIGSFMGSPTFGIKEEYTALCGDNSVNVKGVLCMNKAGQIVQPTILRNGQFMDLGSYLKKSAEESLSFGFGDVKSAYAVHLDSYIRSNKPTLALIDNVFFVVNFRGRYDMATGSWSDNSVIDLYQVCKLIDIPASIAPKGRNGSLKKGVLCCKVAPQSRGKVFSSVSTLVIADNLYNTYINKFLSGVVYYTRAGVSRRHFLSRRISEFYV